MGRGKSAKQGMLCTEKVIPPIGNTEAIFTILHKKRIRHIEAAAAAQRKALRRWTAVLPLGEASSRRCAPFLYSMATQLPKAKLTQIESSRRFLRNGLLPL